MLAWETDPSNPTTTGGMNANGMYPTIADLLLDPGCLPSNLTGMWQGTSLLSFSLDHVARPPLITKSESPS